MSQTPSGTSSEEYQLKTRQFRKAHRYPKSSQWSTEEDEYLGQLFK